MSIADRWLLPDGVKEILPPQAQQIENHRRRLLDLFNGWGYDLVMPPLIEYLDSLLVGTGNDLSLSTFKVTDQLTGRMMGLRADTTPQVARIDAHSLGRIAPTRLCYVNSVLHTVPENKLAGRSPLQIGAELYGHGGVESDIEVICLMVETLQLLGIDHQLSVDLGHVGIYRALVEAADLEPRVQAELFDLLQRKALTEIDQLIDAQHLASPWSELFKALPRLNGDETVLEKAKALFLESLPSIVGVIADLERIAEVVRERYPAVDLYFDLSELRGFNYHTGVVFAAYTPSYGQPIVKGGRYDQIGKDFGRARPATGFSADLKVLTELAPPLNSAAKGILAPAALTTGLHEAITQLRARGERVICTLSGQQGSAAELDCDRVMVDKNGEWGVEEI